MMRTRSLKLLPLVLFAGAGGCGTFGPTAQWAPVQNVESGGSDRPAADGYYGDAYQAILRRDYGRALDLLQLARRGNEKDPRILNAFGVVYDKLGRFDLSARYYAEAMAADPQSGIVQRNLAYSQELQHQWVGRTETAVAGATVGAGPSGAPAPGPAPRRTPDTSPPVAPASIAASPAPRPPPPIAAPSAVATAASSAATAPQIVTSQSKPPIVAAAQPPAPRQPAPAPAQQAPAAPHADAVAVAAAPLPPPSLAAAAMTHPSSTPAASPAPAQSVQAAAPARPETAAVTPVKASFAHPAISPAMTSPASPPLAPQAAGSSRPIPYALAFRDLAMPAASATSTSTSAGRSPSRAWPGPSVMLLDASGYVDRALRLRARLSGLGWSAAPNVRPVTPRASQTVIRYPARRANVAQALARTLPGRVLLQSCGHACSLIQVHLGTDIGAWRLTPVASKQLRKG